MAGLKEEEAREDLQQQLDDLLDEQINDMHEELQKQIDKEINHALQKEIDDALQKQIDEALDKEMNRALEAYNQEVEELLANQLAVDLRMATIYDKESPIPKLSDYLNSGSQK
jgi:fused signal recognition particle receptor